MSLEKGSKQISLDSLAPQELVDVKKALDEDLQQLTTSYAGLRHASGKFSESKTILADMKARDVGKEIMVPLTSSLYMPGTLVGDDVLVEVGASYFIQQKYDKAQEYCDRKVKMLTESANKVGEIVEHKRMQQMQVVGVLQKKVAEYQKNNPNAK